MPYSVRGPRRSQEGAPTQRGRGTIDSIGNSAWPPPRNRVPRSLDGQSAIKAPETLRMAGMMTRR